MEPEITALAPYHSRMTTAPAATPMMRAVRMARAKVRLAAALKAMAVALEKAARAARSCTLACTVATATRRSWAKAAEEASVSCDRRDRLRTRRP